MPIHQPSFAKGGSLDKHPICEASCERVYSNDMLEVLQGTEVTEFEFQSVEHG
jgi:hypothetical protein